MVSPSGSVASAIIGSPKKSRSLISSGISEVGSQGNSISSRSKKSDTQIINFVIRDEEGVEVAGFQKSYSSTPSKSSSTSKPPLHKSSPRRDDSIAATTATTAMSPATVSPDRHREDDVASRLDRETPRQPPPSEDGEMSKRRAFANGGHQKSSKGKFFSKKGFKKFKFKSNGSVTTPSASESEVASVVSASSGSQFADTRSIIESPRRNTEASFISDVRGSHRGPEADDDDSVSTVEEEPSLEEEDNSSPTMSAKPVHAPSSARSAPSKGIMGATGKRRYAKRVRPNLFPPSEVLRRLSTVKRGRSGPKRLRLYIDDFDDEQYEELLEHLRANTTLFKVQVQRLSERDYLRVRTADELQKLFDVICDLPALEHLCLANVDPVDVDSLNVLLRHHSTLQEVKVHMSAGFLPVEFMQALATIPGLNFAEFDVGESFPVGDILCSDSLETLRIESDNFTFDAKDVLVLMQELEKNVKLKTLYLEPQLTPFTLRILAYALRMNRTLESIHFSLSNDGKPDEAAAALTELLQVLEMNPTLTSMWNHNHAESNIQPDTRERWMEALQNSPNMIEFHLFDEDPEFFHEKDAVLRRNRGVTEVPKSSWFCFPSSIFVEEVEDDEDFEDEYSLDE